ncbi:hypothetical protein D6783_01300 [Candidatus Woesearchaeota archaeon]|nr:MAG: hypothetical protein D6783_01300 [Candidatus Woesearchaeota archaeon]
MQITIDTKKDSPDEIRKAIAFLEHVIANQSGRATSQTSNIFTNDAAPSLTTTASQDGAQQGSIFGIFDNEESSSQENDKDDTPQVIPY